MADLQDIARALEGVADPLGGGSIITTKRVAAPRLEEGRLSLVVDVTGLSSGQRDALDREVHVALEAIPDLLEIRVAMTSERVTQKIIAVASGKGGVGKSTVSANLAVALSKLGVRVGLVDADIYGPSQPRLTATEGQRPEAEEKKLIPLLSAAGIPLLSMGHLVQPGQAIAWRGPMAGNALTQLVDAQWGDVQVLIVDMPPGTGDIQLSMVQKHKPAGAVIVSTPQDLALIDAERAVDLFSKADVPIIGMIENMAGYACPKCGDVSDPFGAGGAEARAAQMGMPFLGRIPLSPSIRIASDAGELPASGEGEDAAPFAGIAAKLATWISNSR